MATGVTTTSFEREELNYPELYVAVVVQPVFRLMFASVPFSFGPLYERVFVGILRFNPDELYLLIPKKESAVYNLAHDNVDRMRNELGKPYETRTENIEVDEDDFLGVFEAVYSRIDINSKEAEKRGVEIQVRIDVTSATTVTAVALYAVAGFWQSAEIYYTRPGPQVGSSEYLGERFYDRGGAPTPIPVSKSATLIRAEVEKSTLHQKVLLTLDELPEKSTKSQAELYELLRRSGTRTHPMQISRVLHELEAHGLVVRLWTQPRRSSVRLTLLGEAIIASSHVNTV
jgi:hypothetical protein